MTSPTPLPELETTIKLVTLLNSKADVATDALHHLDISLSNSGLGVEILFPTNDGDMRYTKRASTWRICISNFSTKYIPIPFEECNRATRIICAGYIPEFTKHINHTLTKLITKLSNLEDCNHDEK